MNQPVLAMIVVLCTILPAYAQGGQMSPHASIQWLPLRGAESREAALARVQAILDVEHPDRPQGGTVQGMVEIEGDGAKYLPKDRPGIVILCTGTDTGDAAALCAWLGRKYEKQP
jgi:hypothetical protein